MLVSLMAPFRLDVREAVGFESGDDVAGGNPSRDVQTVTSTAGDSVEAMSASGGISFPSSASSSAIMWRTSPIFFMASSRVSPHVEAPLEGHLTVLRNRDVPGVIGQVGTVLGRNEINIANFALGRSDASASSAAASTTAGAASVRAEAMAVVQTDQAVTLSTLEELKRISAVISVRAVQI